MYYKFDSRNVTFSEYRRLTPGLGFLIASLLKILYIRLPVRMALPYPGQILVREPSELPEGVYGRLVPFIAPCEYMAKKIPGARLEVIKDAGHSSNLDQPEAFNRVLLDFLGSLP